MGNSLLLTIGAVVLFGLFVLTANNMLSSNTKSTDESEFIITAISLAQSVIDEAKTKAFDEKTVSASVASRSDLTPPASLGRDGSLEAVPVPDTLIATGYRSATKFDDVDDYHLYTRLAHTPRARGYNLSVVVRYASETFPDSSLGSQSYCKSMTVTVTSPHISSPVTLSFPFTY